MSNPPFVMSKYASKEALLTDKCAWQKQRIADLERIIAESQKQEPVCYVPSEEVKTVNGQVRLKNSFACDIGEEGRICVERGYGIPCFGDDIALFASPVIQEGMQLVGEMACDSRTGHVFNILWSGNAQPIGTKLYAMLNAAKEG